MELEPLELRVRPAEERQLGSAPIVQCRIVGQVVDNESPRRRVLLVARSTERGLAQETRIYTLTGHRKISNLATVRHALFAPDMLRACGITHQLPMYQYDIAVANATMTPDRSFVAVSLECRVVATTPSLAEVPTNCVSFMVVLFHPATGQRCIVDRTPHRHLLPILTLKSPGSAEPALVVYSQRLVPELENLYPNRSRVAPDAATQDKLRRAGDEGRSRKLTITHLVEYRLVVSNDSIRVGRHELFKGMFQKKLEAVQIPCHSLTMKEEVLWFQYDPWDHSLMSLRRVANADDTHLIAFHELDSAHVKFKWLAITMPVSIRSRFDRIYASHNVSRDQNLNMRRWVSRTGNDTFALQIAEKRSTPGIAVHMPRHTKSQLGPGAFADAYFVHRHYEFKHKFTQRCLGHGERCQLVYFSFVPKDSRAVKDFYSIHLDTAVDRLAPFFVGELFRFDDRGRMERSKQKRSFPRQPPFLLPTYSDSPRFQRWDSLGFGEHHRVFIFSDGSPRTSIELAVPREAPDRAIFVRMYGMVAVVFHSRPAILIDLEASPPQYMFSCPILNHPDGVAGLPDVERYQQREAGTAGARSFAGSRAQSPDHSHGRSDDDSMRAGIRVGSYHHQQQHRRSSALDQSAAVAHSDNSSNASRGLDEHSRGDDASIRSFGAHGAHGAGAHGHRDTFLDPYQRCNYQVLPISFVRTKADERVGEETDRHCEPVAESRSFDAAILRHRGGGGADVAGLPRDPVVLEPTLTFEGVMENVVMPHLRDVLGVAELAEHIHQRGSLFRAARRPLVRRTRREAHLHAVFNAMSIAASRLVYLPSGRMLSYAVIGEYFDRIATLIFAAPAASLRSCCLYLLIGFYGEAFQRVACGHRLAEAAAQGPTPPGHRPSVSPAAAAGAQVFTSGFSSKCRTWTAMAPHPELAPLLEPHLQERRNGSVAAFRFIPPSREAPQCDHNTRWIEEAGNPFRPTDRVHVQRVVTHMDDTWVRPPMVSASASRRWDHTMPNPAAVPEVDPSDSALAESCGDATCGDEDSRKVRSGGAAGRVPSNESRTRTISQVGALQRHAFAIDAKSVPSAAATNRKGSLPTEARRLLRHGIVTCETRLKSLKEADSDQLLAFTDIALAMERLRCQAPKDLKAMLAPVLERQQSISAGLAASVRRDHSATAADVQAAGGANPAGEESVVSEAPPELLASKPLPPSVVKLLHRRGLYTPPASAGAGLGGFLGADDASGARGPDSERDEDALGVNNDSMFTPNMPGRGFKGFAQAPLATTPKAGSPRGWPGSPSRHVKRCEHMDLSPYAMPAQTSARSNGSVPRSPRGGDNVAPNSASALSADDRSTPKASFRGLPRGGRTPGPSGLYSVVGMAETPAHVTQAQHFADRLLRPFPAL